uniref:Myosin motor domain-containing protein n=1 Tax=Heterorhabditis bacteriophora TaxID=37862 RepID=A0A1I7WHU4_HETBA
MFLEVGKVPLRTAGNSSYRHEFLAGAVVWLN